MTEEITLQTLSDKLDSLSRMTLIGAKTVLDLEETCLFTGLSVYAGSPVRFCGTATGPPGCPRRSPALKPCRKGLTA